jgi:hypothetical protein
MISGGDEKSFFSHTQGCDHTLSLARPRCRAEKSIWRDPKQLSTNNCGIFDQPAI